jgi:hypothetical protein
MQAFRDHLRANEDVDSGAKTSQSFPIRFLRVMESASMWRTVVGEKYATRLTDFLGAETA